MRDNHEGLPEIIDAYELDSHVFGVAQVMLGCELYPLIGVDPAHRRHGLEALETIQVRSSPALVPMLRHPR